MTFIARIRQRSLAWNNWHGAGQPSGSLAGVIFHWEPGNVYRSDILNAEQIAALRDNDNVVFEVISTDMPAPVSVEDVIEDPVDEPDPEPAGQRWKPPTVNGARVALPKRK